MIGQNECIFKQFLMIKKQWYLPDGTTDVNPKEEGMGIMHSSFCSRDFGYGMPLSNVQLDIVNRYIEGKYYLDEVRVHFLRSNKGDLLELTTVVRSDFKYYDS